ncbi:MAG: hypothetical protein JO038_09530 [Alphaproteobacteria bacterium]|nr:hypothetical protein [Alphaproteobacteria bacterium]
MSLLDWAELAVVSAKLEILRGRHREKRSRLEAKQLQQEIDSVEQERELILGRLFDAVPAVIGETV